MNPKPSLAQCLVLHHIADDEVWQDIVSLRWHSMYGRGDCTVQVQILLREGYVLENETHGSPLLSLTAKGREALDRRPLTEVLEKVNGPG